MTERFIVIDDGLDFMIRDTITGDTLIDADGVADVLNDYEKENEQLKSALKELREIGDYQTDRIQELNDENKQLEENIADWETSFDLLKQQLQSEHQQLENAILLERTRMGQNALKQYRDAIQ